MFYHTHNQLKEAKSQNYSMIITFQVKSIGISVLAILALYLLGIGLIL